METNLRNVSGFNRYCGPAVLSILTGKTTDETAHVIQQVTGKYGEVQAVGHLDLLTAVNRLGFEHESVPVGRSLFSTLIGIAATDGMYLVMVPRHFVCIEVKDKQIYFCDNHTKEPMQANASARLMQQCLYCYKVTKRQPKTPEYRKIVRFQCIYCLSSASAENDVIHLSTCPTKY